MPVVFQRYPAGEHGGIQRELVRTEMVVEEMHREQEHHGQDRFFAMYDSGYIEYPARQVRGGHIREPHHHAADADDCHTPERGPVIEFFPVAEVLKNRAWPEAEEPAEHVDRITEVTPVGYQ